MTKSKLEGLNFDNLLFFLLVLCNYENSPQLVLNYPWYSIPTESKTKRDLEKGFTEEEAPKDQKEEKHL